MVLTSNRTREIHDALKRRCLYLWLSYPTFEREYQIVRAKVPQIGPQLTEQVCNFMQVVRRMDFYKRPGIAETLDWAMALMTLHADSLDKSIISETLGCIFKYNEDLQKLTGDELDDLMDRIGLGEEARAMGTA